MWTFRFQNSALSIRPRNALKDARVETVGQLVQKTESELLRMKNFGRKSLREIRETLGSMGLFLGMQPTEGRFEETNPSSLAGLWTFRFQNSACQSGQKCLKVCSHRDVN